MELVNEWLPTGKFIKVDTPFRTDSTYEKEIMSALSLTWHALRKSEMEYYGKFGHNIGRIQHIDLVIRIHICYIDFYLVTQIVALTLPILQGIKCCIKYLDNN